MTRSLVAALLLFGSVSALALLYAPAAYAQTGPGPLGSTTIAGRVKCDGTSITCASDGTITAVGAPPSGAASGALAGTYPAPTLKQNGLATGFSLANQAMFLNGTYTGSGTGPYAEFSVADTAQNLTAGTSLAGLRMDYSFGAGGVGAGNRTGILSVLSQTGATPGTDDTLKFYTSIFGQTYILSPDGGTGGTPRGDYYGLAGLSQAQTGATNLNSIIGGELDVAVQSGASVKYKSALLLASVNNDAVKGSTYDAMLGFTRDNTTTVGFDYLIAAGKGDSLWPLSSTGTIFGTIAPTSGSRTAAHGLNFSGVTFSTDSILVPGLMVEPDGTINIGAGPIASGNGLHMQFAADVGAIQSIQGGVAWRGLTIDAAYLNLNVLNPGPLNVGGVVNMPALATAGTVAGAVCATSGGSILYKTTGCGVGLAGTTAAIGGGALLPGACVAGTVTVTGATTSMASVASPASDPDSVLSTGIAIYSFVSAADTVTVRVCAIVAVTPAAVAYNVRVLQ